MAGDGEFPRNQPAASSGPENQASKSVLFPSADVGRSFRLRGRIGADFILLVREGRSRGLRGRGLRSGRLDPSRVRELIRRRRALIYFIYFYLFFFLIGGCF